VSERLCCHCTNCALDLGQPGYSELTPAAPGSWICYKDHFPSGLKELYCVDNHMMTTVLYLAKDCPDFNPTKQAIELGIE